MASTPIRLLVATTIAAGLLAGCEKGENPFNFKKPPADSSAITGPEVETATLGDPDATLDADGTEITATAIDGDAAEGAAEIAEPTTKTRLVDRDVEAPEVFQVTDQALWDGRPSLGGVWVASPDATDPERVILRNPGNGKFVIGALFRRERENPGPKLQISSDAASALGLLAGQPAKLQVTALRREEAAAAKDGKPILDVAETVASETPDAEIPAAETPKAATIDSPAADTAAIATAAIAAVEAKPAAAPPAPKGGSTTVQIGIFSVEANAQRAADTLTKAGVAAKIRPETSKGKSIWSVTASGDGAKAAFLSKVKGLGFTDAYFIR